MQMTFCMIGSIVSIFSGEISGTLKVYFFDTLSSPFFCNQIGWACFNSVCFTAISAEVDFPNFSSTSCSGVSSCSGLVFFDLASS